MKHVNYIYENPLGKLIDTERLRRKLDYLRQERDFFRRDKYLRRYFSGAIKNLTKRLKAAVKSNSYIRTKWEMLLDPVRRRQVLTELGGEAALLRWEARRERHRVFGRLWRERREQRKRLRAQARRFGLEDIYKPLQSVAPPAPRHILTDKSGWFCLAPTIEARPRYRPSCPRSGEARGARRRTRRLIRLTPDELRGDVLMGLGIMPDGTAFPASPAPEPEEMNPDAPPDRTQRQTERVISTAIKTAREKQERKDIETRTSSPGPDSPGKHMSVSSAEAVIPP